MPTPTPSAHSVDPPRPPSLDWDLCIFCGYPSLPTPTVIRDGLRALPACATCEEILHPHSASSRVSRRELNVQEDQVALTVLKRHLQALADQGDVAVPSFEELAGALNAHGVRTRRGLDWTGQTVFQLTTRTNFNRNAHWQALQADRLEERRRAQLAPEAQPRFDAIAALSRDSTHSAPPPPNPNVVGKKVGSFIVKAAGAPSQ